MDRESDIRARWLAIVAELDERRRRLWAGNEARVIGRGGIAVVHRATGLSLPTVTKGVAELDAGEVIAPPRVRRPGGGRKKLEDLHEELVDALEQLVDPVTRGDPESALRWTA